MTSKLGNNNEAYVWIYLPEKTHPIVAGKILKEHDIYSFRYGQSYLENIEKIPLSPFELPLQVASFYPEGLNTIQSCIRDAGPDAWGRRIIDYSYLLEIQMIMQETIPRFGMVLHWSLHQLMIYAHNRD